MKDIINKLQAEERKIFLTSHHFEGIEELCDVVYLIADGEFKELTEKF